MTYLGASFWIKTDLDREIKGFIHFKENDQIIKGVPKIDGIIFEEGFDSTNAKETVQAFWECKCKTS